jgi:hypothetical protein
VPKPFRTSRRCCETVTPSAYRRSAALQPAHPHIGAKNAHHPVRPVIAATAVRLVEGANEVLGACGCPGPACGRLGCFRDRTSPCHDGLRYRLRLITVTALGIASGSFCSISAGAMGRKPSADVSAHIRRVVRNRPMPVARCAGSYHRTQDWQCYPGFPEGQIPLVFARLCGCTPACPSPVISQKRLSAERPRLRISASAIGRSRQGPAGPTS